MSVQWFPGHMHATRKAIAERMKAGIDVVIELLDARLPGSSANPLLAELTARRPGLKVLNKQDLADASRTADWLAHYNAQPQTRAIGLDASERAPAQRLVAACRELAPQRGGMDRPLRILICGVPNVGKSTLVNTLAGRKAAKTGDEAGITKNEQRITLAEDAYLFDTPGMLWPKIIAPRCGFHLAASGAVGRNAYDEQEVALELLESLVEAGYAALIAARWRQAEVDGVPAEDLLERIGRFRGAVRSGGVVDLQKAAEVVLNDFRSGALGRLTLETPAQIATWIAEGEAEDARRREERAAIREERARQRRKARK
ncbi:ribosome biogenesis GTPase YlqF [Ideonella sp. 4Y16]|uniref:Ribosome biogenesis GTPase A n=1 Tax=Ideonella alba TaxID=2824118 RepID=A0A940Y6G0_9BURK|nr:ribosome biogenesis GTPase YlqF [Ideonella alba]MBQ0931029.1 ribosome biogenesis GTPase YlqF [Ideonella alba]MBQ0942307.1 ribosome biogenesis GTPase YlqF [Ideonella alba]